VIVIFDLIENIFNSGRFLQTNYQKQANLKYNDIYPQEYDFRVIIYF